MTAEIEKRRRAEERIGTLEGELTTLKRDGKANADKAASHDALVARVQELEGEVKASQTARAQDLEIIRRGFTDVDRFRFEHGRAGKDVPKDPAEWAAQLADGKPDKAPTWAQEFLVKRDGRGDGGAGGDEGETDTKVDRTPSNRNDKVKGGGNPGAGAELTPDQQRELYTQCAESGDWSAWREFRGMSTPGGAP